MRTAREMSEAQHFRGLLKGLCQRAHWTARLTLFYETLRHLELIHGRFPQPQVLIGAENSFFRSSR